MHFTQNQSGYFSIEPSIAISKLYMYSYFWVKYFTLTFCFPICKQMSCGHSCPTLCHPGDCQPKRDCQQRLKLFCYCKKKHRTQTCCELYEEDDSRVVGFECGAEKCKLVSSARPFDPRGCQLNISFLIEYVYLYIQIAQCTVSVQFGLYYSSCSRSKLHRMRLMRRSE